jgi:hypothetical protein
LRDGDGIPDPVETVGEDHHPKPVSEQ